MSQTLTESVAANFPSVEVDAGVGIIGRGKRGGDQVDCFLQHLPDSQLRNTHHLCQLVQGVELPDPFLQSFPVLQALAC